MAGSFGSSDTIGRASDGSKRNPLSGAGLLSGVAVVAALLSLWSALSNDQWSRVIREASSRADANEALAEGAMQQQVVNGWHAADLLEAQIEQTHGLAINLLVALAAVAVLLAVIVTLLLRSRRDRQQMPAPVAPPPVDDDRVAHIAAQAARETLVQLLQDAAGRQDDPADG